MSCTTSCRFGLVGMPVPMSRNCRTPSAARYATVRHMKARKTVRFDTPPAASATRWRVLAGLRRAPNSVTLGHNMLSTNILRSAYASPQVVDAGGDVSVGDRGEPGPHDLEHHAAGHIGRAPCRHR